VRSTQTARSRTYTNTNERSDWSQKQYCVTCGLRPEDLQQRANLSSNPKDLTFLLQLLWGQINNSAESNEAPSVPSPICRREPNPHREPCHQRLSGTSRAMTISKEPLDDLLFVRVARSQKALVVRLAAIQDVPVAQYVREAVAEKTAADSERYRLRRTFTE
jgi:hypothetical protein